jgi:hypothetical protein
MFCGVRSSTTPLRLVVRLDSEISTAFLIHVVIILLPCFLLEGGARVIFSRHPCDFTILNIGFCSRSLVQVIVERGIANGRFVAEKDRQCPRVVLFASIAFGVVITEISIDDDITGVIFFRKSIVNKTLGTINIRIGLRRIVSAGNSASPLFQMFL